MAADSAPRRMSVEEYLAFDRASTNVKYEYYDGYVVAMAGGTLQHAEICAFTINALLNALRGKPCRVFTSDAKVLLANARYTYPDVTVSCSEEDRATNEIIRSPRVVFEVLSPSTAYIDKGRKLRDYRACPSIQEYVIIDTEKPVIEVYRRAGDILQYHPFGPDEIVTLTSLGIQIPVAEIYRDTEFPPDPDAP